MQTNNYRTWHCEWGQFALNISQQIPGTGSGSMQAAGTLYHIQRRNNTHLQTFHSTGEKFGLL